VIRYQARLSGPMRDRIDMMVDVPRLDGEALFGSRAEESTATVRERVAGARARQAQRADGTGVAANALSRTIADLAGEETVGRRAVLEAFQLRGQSE
jgi:magnesium chelatase family protein